MQKYEHNLAANVSGVLRAIAGAEVTVTDNATGLQASLYSDNGVTPLAQPLTTDDTGYFGFYAADGKYTATFFSPRIATFSRQILLEDPDDDPFATLRGMAAASGASSIGVDPLVENGAGNVQDALEFLATSKADTEFVEAAQQLIALPQGTVNIETPLAAVQDLNLFPDDCDVIFIEVRDLKPALDGGSVLFEVYDGVQWANSLILCNNVSAAQDAIGVIASLQILNGKRGKYFFADVAYGPVSGSNQPLQRRVAAAAVTTGTRLNGYRITCTATGIVNLVQGSVRAYGLRRGG